MQQLIQRDMVISPQRSKVLKLAGLLGVMTVAMPVHAAPTTQARLVHCGEATCLRLSGHRDHADVLVRIAGQTVSVEGDRAWSTTVPLSTARDWANNAGDALTLTLADAQAGTESKQAVALPPGALGRRIELAKLVVRAY